MSDPAPHGPAVTPPSPSPFSDAEVAAFQHEDRSAATVLVAMMVGIFAAGVVLYVAICWLIL